jgi:hypothetical protein
MAITKSKRALVVITYLSSKNKFNFYNFVESSGITTIILFLEHHYSRIEILKDSTATKSAFLERLRQFSTDPQIQAIDVIIMLHGKKGKLLFYDDSRPDNQVEVLTSKLKEEIASQKAGSKLRLLYSTACYGDSHSKDFLEAGFSTSVGAKAINANSATEFPIVCELWGKGEKISKALYSGESGYEIFDLIAKAAGFEKANSNKDVEGKGNLRIQSIP